MWWVNWVFRTWLHYTLVVMLLMFGGMQVRIARIFNTYGPRMCIDDGRVVSNFVAQVRLIYNSCTHLLETISVCMFNLALVTDNWYTNEEVSMLTVMDSIDKLVAYFVQTLRKEPMTVYGDGKQTRSFQFVSDLVREIKLVGFWFLPRFILWFLDEHAYVTRCSPFIFALRFRFSLQKSETNDVTWSRRLRASWGWWKASMLDLLI